MQLFELKKGLFGYKKNQVHHYIDALNADFSERLTNVETQYAEQIAALEKKNAELATALEDCERENREYRDSYHSIADAIIDAQLYADQSRGETLRRESEARDQLKQTYEKGVREAQDYLAAVEECRRQLALQLAAIDNDLSLSQCRVSEMISRGTRASAAVMEDPAPLRGELPEQIPDALQEKHLKPVLSDKDRLLLFRRNGAKNA